MVASTAIVYAATTTLAQDIQQYDWASLLLSACAGLAGGAGRTFLSQINRTTLVGNTPVLILKDLGVALIAGTVAFMFLEAWNYLADYIHLIPISRGLRVFVLAFAGYSRMKWIAWVDTIMSDVFYRVQKTIRGDGTASVIPAVVPATDVPDIPDSNQEGTAQ